MTAVRRIYIILPESKWQETITKAGFEFVPEKALEISEPVFAEPEPFYTQGEQLTFFGEPVPIEQTEKKTRTKPVNIAVSHTAPHNGYDKSRPAWRKCRAEKP